MDLHFDFIDILCEDHLRANAFQKDFIAIFPHSNAVNVRQLDLVPDTFHQWSFKLFQTLLDIGSSFFGNLCSSFVSAKIPFKISVKCNLKQWILNRTKYFVEHSVQTCSQHSLHATLSTFLYFFLFFLHILNLYHN